MIIDFGNVTLEELAKAEDEMEKMPSTEFLEFKNSLMSESDTDAIAFLTLQLLPRVGLDTFFSRLLALAAVTKRRNDAKAENEIV